MKDLIVHTVRIALILGAIFALTRIVSGWLRKTTERLEQLPELPGVTSRRSATILALATNAIKYLLFFLGGAMVLDELGVNLTPLLASAGIAGLAIGFGAQSLVKDLVSGFFIIFEGQFAVGDIVEINGVLGTVEEVGLRVTRLRSAAGEVRFIPNGNITTVSNYFDKAVALQVNVPVASAEEAALRDLFPLLWQQCNSELSALVNEPSAQGIVRRGDHVVIFVFRAEVIPHQKVLFESKVPAWMTRRLQDEGFKLPNGEEIQLFVAPANPATKSTSPASRSDDRPTSMIPHP